MIISHSHRLIYVKPAKVAGTSVQYVLARHCKSGDIVTRMRPMNWRRSGLEEPYYSTNMGGHLTAFQSRRMAGEKWGEYLKVVSVRNPWDFFASWHQNRLHTRTTEKTPESFDEFVLQQSSMSQVPNMPHWILDGAFWADMYIRFESLEDDTREVLRRIGVEHEVIPHLRERDSKPHYSAVYSDESRQIVGQMYQAVIERFGYEFEEG